MAYIGPAPNPGQNREVDDISSGFNGGTASFTLQVNGQNVSPGSAGKLELNVGKMLTGAPTKLTAHYIRGFKKGPFLESSDLMNPIGCNSEQLKDIMKYFDKEMLTI